MRICPAPAGAGIVFQRNDLAGTDSRLSARFDQVSDTRLCTRIGADLGASIGTIEHAMAALAGLGITDARLEVSGPEVPILDGSAQAIVTAISAAGITELPERVRAIRIERAVEVVRDGRMARLLPSDASEMAFEISFDDPAIGDQALELTLTRDAFIDELADCRTFVRLGEVEMLRQAGLAQGGSLENAIVVDRARVLNPEGLRRPDEFVRHKMLDAVGDLALAGAPIIGRYEGVRAGHEMTNLLLRALFAVPQAWRYVTPEEGQILSPARTPRQISRPASPVAV